MQRFAVKESREEMKQWDDSYYRDISHAIINYLVKEGYIRDVDPFDLSTDPNCNKRDGLYFKVKAVVKRVVEEE